jgi:hypothetical protein
MNDKIRAEFEIDAESYGYDLKPAACPCCTYYDDDTENRWMGFQACAESKQDEIERLEARVLELEEVLQYVDDFYCFTNDSRVNAALKEVKPNE